MRIHVLPANNEGAGCEFELWDCGGDPEFESYWPALMKDSHGVVIVFNASILSHLKEIEMWYSCFVQQQFLQNTPCLLIAHHKPGSRSYKENPALAPPLNKLKLVHLNLEDYPEEIRMGFIQYLRSIINLVSESRDPEEMSTSQMKLISVQSLKSIHLRRFSFPFGCEGIFFICPKDQSARELTPYGLFSILSSAEKILLLNSDSFAPDLSKELKRQGDFFFLFLPSSICHVIQVVEL